MNDLLNSMSNYAAEVNDAFDRLVQPLRFLVFLSMLLFLLHFWGSTYEMSAKIAVGAIVIGVFFARGLYLSQGAETNDALPESGDSTGEDEAPVDAASDDSEVSDDEETEPA